MQKHQFAGDAGRRAPSWFLARGDQRYGPLGDRELLLLAERGGLQTDDLLWKPGFTSWKSVHAVCGVKTLHSTPPKSLSPKDAEYLLTGEARSGHEAETAGAADVRGTVKPIALERWSTGELETALCAGMFDNIQRYEAERILRQRELVPDRKLARRIYNNAAWALAFSLGTFIVALGIFGVIASGYRLP
jgi:GYF domain 2